MLIIPFEERFRQPMLTGAKTITSQTRRYGKVGDQFEAWGQPFELVSVGRMPLVVVRDMWYANEGCTSQADFELVWRRLHPRKGFVPYQLVWVHGFKRLAATDWRLIVDQKEEKDMTQPQAPEPVKSWRLTPLEQEALRQRSLARMGAKRLLAELQQLKGLEAQMESAWWEALIRRLHIPAEYKYRLLADFETGYVWVKGEAPDLDAIQPVSDSPAY